MTLTACLLLAINTTTPFSVMVKTSNEGSYPWLVPDAHALYESSPSATGNPSYVLPNGTFLWADGPACAGNNCTTIAKLSWLVTGRTGNTVDLVVNYTISGKEVVGLTEEANRIPFGTVPIPFNYSTSLVLRVDVQSGMAYAGTQPLGILGFWSDPLPMNQTSVTFGTATVGGTSYNISGVSDICECGLAVPVDENGVTFRGVLPTDFLVNAVFVRPLQGTFDGRDYSATIVIGGHHVPYEQLSPIGTYDYYNGLAMSLFVPQFPTPEVSICVPFQNSTTDCQVASTYATTLGQYMRTSLGAVDLVSTNISLFPTSASAPVQLIWLAIPVASVAAVASYAAYRKARRKRLQEGSHDTTGTDSVGTDSPTGLPVAP